MGNMTIYQRRSTQLKSARLTGAARLLGLIVVFELFEPVPELIARDA